ncbi:hypothetical protein NCCP2716_24670 [Sporosarcina sp. NCCP-2716]|uniref:N-acetylmuramoyl-L-alanine amidase family protein n=1 Tax=Sporosarcina sp. NCCP-2716 TaxID=2943679 RepID=UPI002041A195|nr:N-acetylmuramoyl-L-alanine amidase [Sporosarcina sp. NCCP-2716]GKV69969.1 hypothetical protein NCCP2716_24670 [Sporosarcina sp. NCCP-2716]
MKIVLDAGHGLGTPGKRTPDGEPEWAFNNTVLLAAEAALAAFKDVRILRTDDPSGRRDVPLQERTDRANAWNADLFVSFHHNANTGAWGDWGGTETFTLDARRANPKSADLARILQPAIVRAMGLRDRGVKKRNLHVLRETHMPAVLIEGGFMDSRTDIRALRDPARLQAQGVAAASAIAAWFGLTKRQPDAAVPAGQPGKQFRLATGTFPDRRSADNAAAKLRQQFGWTVYVKEGN